MPSDAEEWKQRMIYEGRMKDDEGWYHFNIDSYISESERAMIDMVDSLIEG